MEDLGASQGRRKAKSYWSSVSCDGERSKAAVRSWFAPLANDMIPETAEILCDVETDKEKKIRAVMVSKDGKKCVFTRTLGQRFTISKKPL